MDAIDKTGIATLATATASYAIEKLKISDINDWIILLTSVGGLVFVIYKIATQIEIWKDKRFKNKQTLREMGLELKPIKQKTMGDKIIDRLFKSGLITTIIGIVIIGVAVFMYLSKAHSAVEAGTVAAMGLLFLRAKNSLIGLPVSEDSDDSDK